jgi:hypothetical protein
LLKATVAAAPALLAHIRLLIRSGLRRRLGARWCRLWLRRWSRRWLSTLATIIKIASNSKDRDNGNDTQSKHPAGGPTTSRDHTGCRGGRFERGTRASSNDRRVSRQFPLSLRIKESL